MIRFARKRYCRNPGCQIQPQYQLMIDSKTGAEEVYKVGEYDLQAEIQSHAKSCDINIIIKRIRNGESSLLNANPGMYGDFTNMPTTMAELLNLRHNAENSYNNLPADVRSKFDSLGDYLSTAGSVDWLKKLGYKIDDEKKEVADEQTD